MFSRLKMIMAVALARAMGGRTPASLQRIAADHNRAVDALHTDRVRGEPLLPRLRGRSLIDSVARLIGTRQVDRGAMHWGPNGAQERARRTCQIAAYQLTASNGLIMPAIGEPGKFVTGNSHGGLCYWPS